MTGKIKIFIQAVRYYIISLLLNEDEKCIIAQGLNEARQGVVTDYSSGLSSLSDFRDDIEQIDCLSVVFKNKLWI